MKQLFLFFCSTIFLSTSYSATKSCTLEFPDFDKTISFSDTLVVGPEVKTLGTTFDFRGAKEKLLRVVLAIDETSSNCNNNPYQHNDVNNGRIFGAHYFVDSLASKSPRSEIGVSHISYTNRTPRVFDFYSLDNPSNVTQIKNDINSAACRNGPLPKSRSSNKVFATGIGKGIETAIGLVDRDYAVIQDSLERHIIVLTDGQWDDGNSHSYQTLLNNYKSNHPGRPYPIIHAIVVSDSAWHVNHGAPPFPTDTTDLKAIADSTGGFFAVSAKDTTTIQYMNDIYRTIYPEMNLKSLKFVALQSEQSYNAQLTEDNDTNNLWHVTIPTIPLSNGLNEFACEWTIGSETHNDTLQIIQSENEVETPVLGEFMLSCVTDPTSRNRFFSTLMGKDKISINSTTDGSLVIRTTHENIDAYIELFNLSGANVFSAPIRTSHFTIPAKTLLPGGVFIVKVRTEKSSVVRKVRIIK